ncbi:MAG: hypothetical protein AAB788_04105 [Patescibacteria group bacterium]
MKKQILKIGFDLDGVLLYNPARIARPIVSIIKRFFVNKKQLHFYSPKTFLGRQLWRLFHKSSIFISPGLSEIKELIKKKKIKAYIITARYSYLKSDLEKWLKEMKINESFSGIYYNQNDEQPHLFKERVIKKLGIDIFVEDNFDIVSYLKKQVKVFWIYNIFDRNLKYKHKFSSLKSVVKFISQ